eukprot:scaffold5985_cov112-Isochrysis_galbana.AAC.2
MRSGVPASPAAARSCMKAWNGASSGSASIHGLMARACCTSPSVSSGRPTPAEWGMGEKRRGEGGARRHSCGVCPGVPRACNATGEVGLLGGSAKRIRSMLSTSPLGGAILANSGEEGQLASRAGDVAASWGEDITPGGPAGTRASMSCSS